MMYPDYAGWLIGVRDWLDADHLSDAQINTFMVIAQKRLNRELAVFEMEASTPLLIAATGPTLLPADFNRVRQVYLESAGTYVTKDKGEFVNRVAKEDQSERIYCIDNAGLQVYPGLDGTVNVTFDYYIKVPTLETGAVETNVFTEDYPDLLLFAALAEGSNFIVEDDRMQLFEAKYAGQLELANGQRTKVKYGSTPLKRNIRG